LSMSHTGPAPLPFEIWQLIIHRAFAAYQVEAIKWPRDKKPLNTTISDFRLVLLFAYFATGGFRDYLTRGRKFYQTTKIILIFIYAFLFLY
jgi:hypothetical protein